MPQPAIDPQTLGFQPCPATKVWTHSRSLVHRTHQCFHTSTVRGGTATVSWPAAAGVKGFHPRPVPSALNSTSSVQTTEASAHHHLGVERAAPLRITTRRVLVRMSIPMRVEFGEVLKVVGSGEEFGNWLAARAPRFEWTQGDVWVGNMLIEPGLYEFKVVVFNERTQALRWETSANRVLEVPSGPGTLTLSAHWNAPSTQGWFEPGLPDLTVRLSTPNATPSHPTVGSVLLPGVDAAGTPASMLSRGWDAMLRRGGGGGGSPGPLRSGSSSSGSDSDSGSSSRSSSSHNAAGHGSQSSSSSSSKSVVSKSSTGSTSKWKSMAAGNDSGSSSTSSSDKDRALLVEGMRGLLKSMSATKADSNSSSGGSHKDSSTHTSSAPSSSSNTSKSAAAAFSNHAEASSSSSKVSSGSSGGMSRATPTPSRSSSSSSNATPTPSRSTASNQPSQSKLSGIPNGWGSIRSTASHAPTAKSTSGSGSEGNGSSTPAAAGTTAQPVHRYTPRPSSSSSSPSSSHGSSTGVMAAAGGWWGSVSSTLGGVMQQQQPSGSGSSSSSSSRGFTQGGLLEELDISSMTDSQKVVRGLAGMLGKGALSVSTASQSLLVQGMQQLKEIDREALLNGLRHSVDQLANSEAAAAAHKHKPGGGSSSRGGGRAPAIISPVVETCSQVMQVVGDIVTTKSPSAMRGDAADFIEMSEGYRKKPPLPPAGLTTRRTPLKREEAVRALVERAAKVRAAKQGGGPLPAAAASDPSSSIGALHGGPTQLEPNSTQHQQQRKGQAMWRQEVWWQDPFTAVGATVVVGVVVALLGTEQHGIRQAVGARVTQVTKALIAPVEVVQQQGNSTNTTTSSSSSNSSQKSAAAQKTNKS